MPREPGAIDATGNAVDNVITGNSGDNTFAGGPGNDTAIGSGGDDTAVFSQSLASYLVRDRGDRVFVSGPDGIDKLLSIEHLRFADGTVNLNDGNALFDTLFYLQPQPRRVPCRRDRARSLQYVGWHEGRDPNAVLRHVGLSRGQPGRARPPASTRSTTITRPAGTRGAIRRPNFDTTLYLIHNPDVAAAGIDPLAHYLAVRHRRRPARPIAAIGQNIVGGFDAAVLPVPQSRRGGGRHRSAARTTTSPAGTKGATRTPGSTPPAISSHYADVAAAGINPLQHYEAVGWTEGRDPSAGFDTLGYLAANPDVAAAHINPLDHFLQIRHLRGPPAGQ